MFIERGRTEGFPSLQRSETWHGARTIPKHCAPLERASSSPHVSINIRLRWSQKPNGKSAFSWASQRTFNLLAHCRCLRLFVLGLDDDARGTIVCQRRPTPVTQRFDPVAHAVQENQVDSQP